jgi:mannose-6-phosphate isomerase-like protein (cupin superfamily)
MIATTSPDKINLSEKLALFDDQWSPKIIGSVDNYDVKVVKLLGEFVWHAHENDDEMFFVISGQLNIDFRDKSISLTPGEMIIVPKGVEHKPHAIEECQVMVFERNGVINTGNNEQSDLTARNLERI